MSKSELVTHVAARAFVSKATADAMVSAVFSTIGEALARDEAVVITAFGTFTTRAPRNAPGTQPRHRREHPDRRLQDPGVQAREDAARYRQRPDMSQTPVGVAAHCRTRSVHRATFLPHRRRHRLRHPGTEPPVPRAADSPLHSSPLPRSRGMFVADKSTRRTVTLTRQGNAFG